jgi:hypothetical protein
LVLSAPTKWEAFMARHIPQIKRDLMRQQRDELLTLLRDAYAIIEALDDPTCEPWLGQARAALAKVQQ